MPGNGHHRPVPVTTCDGETGPSGNEHRRATGGQGPSAAMSLWSGAMTGICLGGFTVE